MNFDISSLKWIRKPRQYTVQDGRIEITTIDYNKPWGMKFSLGKPKPLI